MKATDATYGEGNAVRARMVILRGDFLGSHPGGAIPEFALRITVFRILRRGPLTSFPVRPDFEESTKIRKTSSETYREKIIVNARGTIGAA